LAAARKSRIERDVAASGVTSAPPLRKGVSQTMVLAVILPGFHEGILKTIFIDTGITFTILGQPAGGFHLTLLDLIIVGLLAFAVTAITEWLTGQKLGKLFTGMLVTIVGALLVLMFVHLPAPLDFAIEDIAVVAALIGATIVGVFYSLIRARTSSKSKAAPAHA
jgi:predicted secreted protein